MLNIYTTSQVAKIIGIHPNTVRLYEELKLIPKPRRKRNGYRIFTEFHIAQFQLARTALKIEVLQNGLRKKAIEIIKNSATGNLEKAKRLTKNYLQQIKQEQKNAEEAIGLVTQLLSDNKHEIDKISLSRKETADYLQVSIDTLRNWEMNGLLTVKRKENGYRVYTSEDIRLLKIIRSLRCANYSLSAILRMINKLPHTSQRNIKQVLDTPDKEDDIISVCDKLLTSLQYAEKNAQTILVQLDDMKNI